MDASIALPRATLRLERVRKMLVGGLELPRMLVLFAFKRVYSRELAKFGTIRECLI